MYEIRKRSTTQPDIWYPVAWSDQRVYAAKIAELMNVYEDGEFGVFETNDTPSASGVAGRGGSAGRKRPGVTVDMTKDLELMDRDELKAYARAEGIRLYTVVPEKMRKQIREIEYTRAHHGDAFRDHVELGETV